MEKVNLLKLETDLLNVSKPYQILPGDKVINVDKQCMHYKSTGDVVSVDAEGNITYKVNNQGATFTPGDFLKKSDKQLIKVFMRTPRPGYGSFSNE